MHASLDNEQTYDTAVWSGNQSVKLRTQHRANLTIMSESDTENVPQFYTLATVKQLAANSEHTVSCTILANTHQTKR